MTPFSIGFYQILYWNTACVFAFSENESRFQEAKRTYLWEFYESMGLTEANFLSPLAKLCVQDAGSMSKKITDHLNALMVSDVRYWLKDSSHWQPSTPNRVRPIHSQCQIRSPMLQFYLAVTTCKDICLLNAFIDLVDTWINFRHWSTVWFLRPTSYKELEVNVTDLELSCFNKILCF